MKFDMGSAWNEGIARVRANFQLLAVLGGVFFFVPSVLMFVMLPDVMGAMMSPNFDPENSTAILESLGPTFVGIYLLVIIASFVGYTAMIALMGDGRRVSVGESIGIGFKALLPLVALMVLFLVAYLIAAFGVGIVLGLIIAGLGAISEGLAGVFTFVAVIGLIAAMLWVMTRLSLTLPVIALENTLNPIKALTRSWQLTGPSQGRLFLFYVVLTVAYIVVALVVFMVLGLFISAIGAPTALGFLNGIVSALVAMVFSGLVVAIYLQLVGTTAAVSETFE